MSLSPAVITDLSRSPHARLKPVPLEAVCLRDEFWQPRRERNGQCTLPSQFEELRCTGRLDNFRRAAGEDFPHSGTVDADVHKWMEAVAWSLAEHPDNALAEKLDAVIELVARAQQPGGYLCTTYSEELADRRWQNLEGGHEL